MTAKRKKYEYCLWGYDGDMYETNCGNAFYMTEGNPNEDGFDYCPYCAKKIKVYDIYESRRRVKR